LIFHVIILLAKIKNSSKYVLWKNELFRVICKITPAMVDQLKKSEEGEDLKSFLTKKNA
jgi:hypothetical protein